ncbi:MAG: aminoacyl--tRNA ligase-related protein [Thermoplasmata archaeon]
MKFEMEATLTFSGEISELGDEIDEIVEKANGDLLKRGVPKNVEGGASIVESFVSGDELKVTILSDRYVRAHDALIRFKKKLGEELGPKHHLGVRETEVHDYTIEFELEEEPKDEISIPFVDNIQFSGSTCKISVAGLTDDQLARNFVDRIIKRVKEKVDAQYYGGKEEMWKLLWESEKKNMVWNKDPTAEMEKRGWILKGPTKGKWFYRPQAAKILRTMEELAIREVLEPLAFQEVIESFMVPFDVWMGTGHMEGIPNEAYYICEPKTRDEESWEEVIDHIKISKEVPVEKLAEMVTEPRAGVCYAQCPVIYWSLKNQTIADENLPVLVYDKTTPSARYESGGRHGIERVDEFHRIEPVYIGTEEQLIDLKEKLIERYKHVFEDILEIEWRMAQVTPFYLQQAGEEEEESDTELGTVDFEAYMPYRGTREDSEWLEYQNLSIFKKYTESFNIKSQTKELYSGCSGIGIERWVAVFLAQKGIDPEGWPEEFRKRFGEMPEGIELL